MCGVEQVTCPAGAGSSAAVTKSVTRYRLVAPHHKSERHHGRALEFNLPSELNLLLHTHLVYGLQVVMGSSGPVSADAFPYVFCRASTRKQLVAQQASQVWKRVVLPSSFSFGPQTARAAFVTGVRDPNTPSAQFTATAAAEAMGHSVRMWQQVYDKMHRQHAQAACCAEGSGCHGSLEAADGG